MQNHARPCIAHDITHLSAHGRAVAMHRAFAACRLAFAETAAVKTRMSVGYKLTAFITQSFVRIMMMAAEYGDHLADGLLFSFNLCHLLFPDNVHILVVRDMPPAHALQMLCLKLAVNKSVVRLELLREVYQSQF